MTVTLGDRFGGTRRKRYAAWSVALVGALLATVLPDALEGTLGDPVLLGLSVVGGTTLWAGAMWAEHLQHTEGCADERLTQIHLRAGWVAFWTMVGLTMVLGFALGNTDYTLQTGYLLALPLFVGVVVFMGTVAVLKRRM
ncbi:hypothetical protein ACKVMT_15215 [Halobacteriales archaeon Cl-PHB]